MSVTAYPRLGVLLRERHLSVAALGRPIEARTRLVADPKTLYRFTRGTAIRRADLEVAGAAASVLRVALGDLFDVHICPGANVPHPGWEEEVIRRSERLAVLFAQQATGVLPREGRIELERLLTEYERTRSEIQI